MKNIVLSIIIILVCLLAIAKLNSYYCPAGYQLDFETGKDYCPSNK
jgi:hypothetical protein